jgi:SAM-dependent methyltransferase
MVDSSREQLNSGKQRFFDNTAGGWENGRRDDPAVIELVAELPLNPGNLVVEPGCGTGLVSELLLERITPGGRLLAFDISPRMIELAEAKRLGPTAEFHLADASSIPLKTAAADVVLCIRVFPHIDNRQGALAEFNRVLKNDGKLIIAHPAGREKLNTYHSNVGGEVGDDMIPEEPGMRSLLAGAGFELLELVDHDARYLVTACKRRDI